ncbi:hypothetical protein BDV93DRAFT_563726 [Ceratobasidium sp. AG-I]|nr:hypothetical protein BDV93DRAFT_563726 [Ceratobasidium sp. AG-I]
MLIPAAQETSPSTHANNGQAQYNKPRSWRWDDHGRMCSKVYVENVPFSTVCQPISQHRTHPLDLGKYLREIGGLAHPETILAAEQIMTEGLSCNVRTRFLKSSFYKGKVPWRNNRELLTNVDKLLHVPSWMLEELIASKGEFEQVHIIYKCSVIDVICDLIGNPCFKDFMRYMPEQHWTSRKMESRVYGEMWMGNWWWRSQLFLRNRKGAIVPIILASDKTQMAKLSSNQAANPVYLTIGNISKAI